MSTRGPRRTNRQRANDDDEQPPPKSSRGPSRSGGRAASASAADPSKIIYALVAPTNTVIWAENKKGGTSSHVVTETAVRVLYEVDLTFPHKKTFKDDQQGSNYLFNYEVADGVCFMCVSTKDFKQRTSFVYLALLRDEYFKKYKNTQKKPREFKVFMENERKKIEDPKSDKLTGLQADVDDIKSVMADNLEKGMKNTENMQDITGKTEELQESTQAFKESAKKLECVLCKKNAKITAILCCCCITLGLIIGLSVYFSTR